MNFEVVFYVGVMLLALIISVAQAASAKRFSFRQGMSFFQSGVYASVVLAFAITGGFSASFRFWTTVGFFLCAFGEAAEVALLLNNGAKYSTPNVPMASGKVQRTGKSSKAGEILDKIHESKEKIKRENPGIVIALNVVLSLTISFGISLVSLSLITGYIPPFLLQ